MKQVFSRFIATMLLCGVALIVGARYYYYLPFYKKIREASAVIHPTKDNTVAGVVNFLQKNDGVLITAQLTGMTPGQHGFHIHEMGDCNCDDAACAGGHFNPTNQPHGGPQDTKRHVGDLGNVVADENGNVAYQALDTHITLNGPQSIIGRSVIIHADPDDYVSQPTGNAGKRVGCGVVGIKG